MITVCCVWVKGNVKYDVEYVTRLRAMVRRHLGRQHRFVCLSDQPDRLQDNIEGIRIPAPHPHPGWWAKLQLFNPQNGLAGRVIYLDLDTLVVDDLAPIVDYPERFALIPDGGSQFQPTGKKRVVKRFNSSCMVWDAGVMARLFTDWTPDVAKRLWGDQDWYGEQAPDAATLPSEWFPRLSTIGEGGQIPEGARVVLSKVPKNVEAAARWPWFDARWRAA